MSIVRANQLQLKSGKSQYAAKAWVNIWGTNGAGASVAASGNVSSITDDGIGLYTSNFANAMSNIYYSVTMAFTDEVSVAHTVGFIANGSGGVAKLYSTTQCRTVYWNTTASANRIDKVTVGLTFFE